MAPFPKRIAVLCGGWSAEREVSLISGKEVARALSGLGYEVNIIDFNPKTPSELEQLSPDLVFIALHGCPGEDGSVQGLLESMKIPFTGSGVVASALGINKSIFKRVLKSEEIPTPGFFELSGDEWGPAEINGKLKKLGGLPAVVKPASEGSTIGMTIVKEEAGLLPALELAFKHDKNVLVEKFIQGTEITIGILGNSEAVALPTLEIVFEGETYDYEAKYTAGKSSHIIPARISPAAEKRSQEIALAAYKLIGCRGFSRVDIIIDEADNPWILEINTIPGMTPLSLYPDAARAAGIEFPELVDRLVKLALEE